MKKQIKKILKTFAIILCVLPYVSQAQIPTINPVNCPFYIFNHRTCDITVHYEVSDCNANLPTPPTACGFGIICNSTGIIIPAGTSILLPCCNANPGSFISPPCWSPGGDIFVWLKEINGVDVTGGNNNHAVSGGNCMGTGIINATGPIPSSLGAPCGIPNTYILNWSPVGVDIW